LLISPNSKEQAMSHELEIALPAGEAQILVPLDGSALAEAALPQALALAPILGASVTLLRVVQYQPVLSPLTWNMPTLDLMQEIATQVRTAAQDYLTQVRTRLEAGGVRVQTVLVEQELPAEAVAAAARDPQVRLIAMATHGRGGLRRWLLGSVADEVLHTAPVALLVVRPPAGAATGTTPLAPPAYRVILVPLDGSPLAEVALDWATRVALGAHARVVLLTVLPPREILPAEITAYWPAAADALAPAPALAAYLEPIATRLRAAGVPTTVQVVAGDPATEIEDQATIVHADLIVMATHGRTGLPRLRLGSVATKVVQGSSGPVLLVRK